MSFLFELVTVKKDIIIPYGMSGDGVEPNLTQLTEDEVELCNRVFEEFEQVQELLKAKQIRVTA